MSAATSRTRCGDKWPPTLLDVLRGHDRHDLTHDEYLEDGRLHVRAVLLRANEIRARFSGIGEAFAGVEPDGYGFGV